MVPATLAKKGNGIVVQGIVARPTIHGKHRVEKSAKQSSGHVFPAREVSDKLRKTPGDFSYPVKRDRRVVGCFHHVL